MKRIISLLSLLLITLSINAHAYYTCDYNFAEFNVDISNDSDSILEFEARSQADNACIRQSINPNEAISFKMGIQLPAYYTLKKRDQWASPTKHELGRDDKWSSSEIFPYDFKWEQSYFARQGNLRLSVKDDFHSSRSSQRACSIPATTPFDVTIENHSEWVLEFEVFAKTDDFRLLKQTVQPKTTVEFAMNIELPAYYTVKKKDQFFSADKHPLGKNDKWSSFFGFHPYTLKWDQNYSECRNQGSLSLIFAR